MADLINQPQYELLADLNKPGNDTQGHINYYYQAQTPQPQTKKITKSHVTPKLVKVANQVEKPRRVFNLEEKVKPTRDKMKEDRSKSPQMPKFALLDEKSEELRRLKHLNTPIPQDTLSLSQWANKFSALKKQKRESKQQGTTYTPIEQDSSIIQSSNIKPSSAASQQPDKVCSFYVVTASQPQPESSKLAANRTMNYQKTQHNQSKSSESKSFRIKTERQPRKPKSSLEQIRRDKSKSPQSGMKFQLLDEGTDDTKNDQGSGKLLQAQINDILTNPAIKLTNMQIIDEHAEQPKDDLIIDDGLHQSQELSSSILIPSQVQNMQQPMESQLIRTIDNCTNLFDITTSKIEKDNPSIFQDSLETFPLPRHQTKQLKQSSNLQLKCSEIPEIIEEQINTTQVNEEINMELIQQPKIDCPTQDQKANPPQEAPQLKQLKTARLQRQELKQQDQKKADSQPLNFITHTSLPQRKPYSSQVLLSTPPKSGEVTEQEEHDGFLIVKELKGVGEAPSSLQLQKALLKPVSTDDLVGLSNNNRPLQINSRLKELETTLNMQVDDTYKTYSNQILEYKLEMLQQQMQDQVLTTQKNEDIQQDTHLQNGQPQLQRETQQNKESIIQQSVSFSQAKDNDIDPSTKYTPIPRRGNLASGVTLLNQVENGEIDFDDTPQLAQLKLMKARVCAINEEQLRQLTIPEQIMKQITKFKEIDNITIDFIDQHRSSNNQILDYQVEKQLQQMEDQQQEKEDQQQVENFTVNPMNIEKALSQAIQNPEDQPDEQPSQYIKVIKPQPRASSQVKLIQEMNESIDFDEEQVPELNLGVMNHQQVAVSNQCQKQELSATIQNALLTIKSFKPTNIVSSQPIERDQEITTWELARKYAENGEYEEAYSLVLQQDDELLLLRLMRVTGPVCESLQSDTLTKLIRQLDAFTSTDMLELVGLDLYDQVVDHGIESTLPNQAKEDLQITLHSMSRSKNNELGYAATNIYNTVQWE